MSEIKKQPEEMKTPKKRINKKPRTSDSVIIAVGISIAVLLAISLGIGIYFIINKGDNPNNDNASDFHEISTNEKGETFAKITDDEGNDIYVPIEAKEQVNVLVIGKDRWAFNTDVMMIVAYNIEEQSVTMMQIPRDTYIELYDERGYVRGNQKANSILASFYSEAYRSGKNSDEALKIACENFKLALSDTLGFPINYYVMMDLNGFVDIVNVIGGKKGGIEIDVPYRMKYYDPEQNFRVDLQPGKQILDGNKAEQFVRFRADYIEGDIGRVDAQKIFISACLAQIKENFNITTIVGVAESVMKYVITDIPLDNLLYYAKEAMSVDLDSAVMLTMPGVQDNNNSAGTWYYIVSRPSMLKIINKYFNPHTVDIKEERFDQNGALYDYKGSSIYNVYMTDHDKQEYSADNPDDIYIYHSGASHYSGNRSNGGSGNSSGSATTTRAATTSKRTTEVTVPVSSSGETDREIRDGEPKETVAPSSASTTDNREEPADSNLIVPSDEPAVSDNDDSNHRVTEHSAEESAEQPQSSPETEAQNDTPDNETEE